MTDKEKLMQLFSELTVFATPAKSAEHFLKNNVTIQKFGHWKQTGWHFLPYQCSACESKEEGGVCRKCGLAYCQRRNGAGVDFGQG